MLQNDYVFAPKLSSEKLPDGRIVSKPLEDMFRFLIETSLRKICWINPIKIVFGINRRLKIKISKTEI